MTSPIECRLEPIGNIAGLEPTWRHLQERTNCAYFLSWSWIGTWLKLLPISPAPLLLTATEDGEIVGLAIAFSRSLRRHGVISSKAIFLNKTGDDALDEISIEYNGILAESTKHARVMRAAIDYFMSNGWDEVFIDAAQSSDAFVPPQGARWDIRRRIAWSGHTVDLQKIRNTGATYLYALSGNMRNQLRRALREYEKLGPLRVESAGTSRQDAESWLGELGRLHQISWVRKGKPGAFSNSFFKRFHAELVAEKASAGEIQILRVGFGDHWIGYLYNFCWNGVVHNYQSGFDYDLLAEKNWPGTVAQFAAIEFNLRNGANCYDFLGGENQQKRSLATETMPLDWIVARRRCMKFRFEDSVRKLRDRMFS